MVLNLFNSGKRVKTKSQKVLRLAMFGEVTEKKLVGGFIENLLVKILTKLALILCVTSVLKKLVFVVN